MATSKVEGRPSNRRRVGQWPDAVRLSAMAILDLPARRMLRQRKGLRWPRVS